MSRASRSPWIEEADRLLEDFEWHDGVEFLRDLKKKITPGVAQRHAERIRVRQLERRSGISLDTVPERVRPLSIDAQIASGKQSLARGLINDRVRGGVYKIEPWPVPEDGWRRGGWKIRKVLKYTPTSLKSRYNLSPTTIRRFILADPPVPHVDTGSGRLQLTAEALPELDRRVDEYRQQSTDRRKAAAGVRWQRYNAQEPTHISITDLAKRSRLSKDVAVRLANEHPELDWEREGRTTRLPLGRLDAWDQVIAAYKISDVGRLAERRAQSRRAQRDNDE